MNKSAQILTRINIKKRKKDGTMVSHVKNMVNARIRKNNQKFHHAYDEIITNGISQCAECGSGEKWRLQHYWKCKCGAMGNGEIHKHK